MTTESIALMNRGMQCLVKELGDIAAEEFISMLLRERFDYTVWQKEYFKDVSLDEINEAAAKYDEEHPW